MTGPGLEAQWFAWALALGAGLGLLYDALRDLRPRCLGDLIFVGASFWAWLYLGFGICGGQLRFGYTAGLGIGALLWELSIGRLLRPVFRGFWRILWEILVFLFRPVQKIWNFFRKNCKLLLAETKKWVTMIAVKFLPGRRAAGGVTCDKEKKTCEGGVSQKQHPDHNGSAGGFGGLHRHPDRSVRRHKRRPAGS